ncbi:HAD-IIIC family phosphatase [Streptomyces jumonjinensis]|uniref:HAD-IIIC family phosphatase n=1 Tax=Streptomyces jumonjinensis TaxID=1945 RepID=UPI00378A4B06
MDPETDFFDAGATSVNAVELVAALARELNVRLTLDDVFADARPRRLAQRWIAGSGATAPPVTAAPPGSRRPVRVIAPRPSGVARPPLPGAACADEDLGQILADLALADALPFLGAPEPMAPRRILLTGATGFLGGHLLLDLLRRSDAHVVCLIRAAGEQQARARLAEALTGYRLPWSAELRRRITTLPGDIRQPRLGPAEDRWQAGAVRAVRRTPPKAIAVDGDETLWTGVAGEQGPAGVDLGGARALLARRLLRWRAAGALLVLVGNNDELTVESVLDRPDSVLRKEHFSLISAEWGRKAARLEKAARELNLGLDDFLFLDDNPVEIASMRAALPEVLSVTCPPAGELESFLARLWPLVPRATTAEDSHRAEFYRQERARGAVREQTGFEEFLDGPGLEIDIRSLSGAEVERSAQLARRTNQFTLRARSADGGDLERWRRQGEVWTADGRKSPGPVRHSPVHRAYL